MVGVSVIGAGNRGKNLVRNLAGLDDVDLKYVCDLDENVRESIAAVYPHTTVTDDFQQALDDDGVDAAVVAVDVPRHFELAKRALEAGKHTYVEKPLHWPAPSRRNWSTWPTPGA